MNDALKLYNHRYGLKGKLVLELGCGNCYNSIFCARQGATVIASDIDSDAITFCKNRAKKEGVKLKVYLANLFENLSEYKNKFDLIFFNPPYLISDTIKYIDLDGLKKGRHWIDKFIEQFPKYLNKSGGVLLMHTDYNDIKETGKKLNKKEFSMNVMLEKHLFFERLYILAIAKKK